MYEHIYIYVMAVRERITGCRFRVELRCPEEVGTQRA
jgi:hypothetical protein